MSGFEFEGDEVREFLAKLPAMTVECDEAYARGTILKLNVEVRVRSVRLEEDRNGNLVRQHIFALEEVSINEKVDPQAQFVEQTKVLPTDVVIEELITDPQSVR